MQSSPVQQMMAAENPTWWNVNNMRAPLTMNNHASSSPLLLPPPHHLSFLTQFQPTTNSNLLPFLPSWHNNDDDDNNNSYPNQSQQHLPESWSQFLFGGVVSEDDKANGMRQLIHQAKKLEDWEEHMYSHQAHSVSQVRDDVKQKDSLTQSSFVYGNHGNNSSEDFQSIALSQLLPTSNITAASASSPKSSSVTSFGSGVLDFSGKSEGRHPPPSRSSSECNSSATGGPAKKARVQPSSSSSAQPTFKVRKEKLGDRVTTLHQLVSPFGKTDTASVLLEAIGYIRFLHDQIEALSLPYLGSGSSPNMRLQQQSTSVHGERNCMFPEDPGQLLNDNCMKLKLKGINSEQDAYQEAKKDLRSRGLCLVPVSCTLHVGSDNGADYWAPAALGGCFQ